MSALAAIILAAGGSTRMGRPKQLLPYRGQALLRRAVRNATDAGCNPIYVVLGSRVAEMLPELNGTIATPVLNEQWSGGIGTSIRCGVEALMRREPEPHAAVLMLCDQVHVDAQVLRDIVTAFDTTGLPVVVSQYADTLGPPIVVNASLYPALLALRDDQGAKMIWMSRPEIVHAFPCEAAATDVDTPEDFEKLTKSDVSNL